MDSKRSTFKTHETIALLDIWSDDDIQKEFNQSKKSHGPVWTKISDQLKAQNISKSATQCKNRVSNLKKDYFQKKRKVTGKEHQEIPYQKYFDQVLGTSSLVQPVLTMDSMDSTLSTSPSTSTSNISASSPNNNTEHQIDETTNSSTEIMNEDDSISSNPEPSSNSNNNSNGNGPTSPPSSTTPKGTDHIDEPPKAKRFKKRTKSAQKDDIITLLTKMCDQDEKVGKEMKASDQAYLQELKRMNTSMERLIDIEEEKLNNESVNLSELI